MRDEDFKQKLSEVAVWQEVRADAEGSGGYKKKADPDAPSTIKVVKLVYAKTSCEDCGLAVEGRHKELQVYKNKSVCGLKEKCLTCGLHKDPYTGQFCLNGTQASIKWSSYSKGYKKRYKSKTEKLPVIESDCVIRYRPEEPFKI